jgi:hypothetical protein
MLQPKKMKFRKTFKGRIKGDAKGGSALNFGAYGLKALEPERDHRPPDRGRTSRHPRATCKSSGPFVDPRVPGRSGVEETLLKSVRVRARVRSNIGRRA